MIGTLANSTGPLRSGDSVCRSIASWLMSKPKQAYIDAANRYKSDHIYQCKSRTKVDVAIQYRSPDQNHENGDHLNCTMKCTRALLATVQQQVRTSHSLDSLIIPHYCLTTTMIVVFAILTHPPLSASLHSTPALPLTYDCVVTRIAPGTVVKRSVFM